MLTRRESQRDDRHTAGPPFISEHIPKTARTTFILSYLATAFSPEDIFILPGAHELNERELGRFMALPLEERLRPRLIAGHNTGRLRSLFSQAHWLTLVRDPVERAICTHVSTLTRATLWVRRLSEHTLAWPVCGAGMAGGTLE